MQEANSVGKEPQYGMMYIKKPTLRWDCRAGAQCRSGLQVELGGGSRDQAVKAELVFACAALVHFSCLAQGRGAHNMRRGSICSSTALR